MSKHTADERILELISKNPNGLRYSEVLAATAMPRGTVGARLAEMAADGRLIRVSEGLYRLPKAATSRPRELVETRTSQKAIPGYMRNQSPRKVTMYSITRLENVMQMKMWNGVVKHITVPLIGQSIRIHIGNEVQSWPFSEAFTGYTEIEFRFSNGETSTISVSSDDVITVALES